MNSTPAGADTTISPSSMYCTRRVSREERGDRRGEELLALAAPDDERALAARADEHVRLVDAHRDEREVAAQLAVGGAHGLGRSPS